MLEHVGVYRGSTLILVIEAEPAIAWKCAIANCHAGAFADGRLTPGKWERPAGRFSYTRGDYRAVSMYRAPVSP